MTGFLNALVGSPSNAYYSVTMADINSLGTIFGYNDSGAPGGSISPTTFRTVTVKVVQNGVSGGTDTFTVTLQGSRSQSFFTGVEIQKTDGSLTTLYTSSASSFVDGGTSSVWGWSVEGTWTAATPSPRRVRIFL